MSIIAVEYTYHDRPELLSEHRPAHRAFLSSLLEAGSLIASGPLGTTGSSALIVLRADSPEEALDLLDIDPFHDAGAIKDRQAREWNVVLGLEGLVGPHGG